MSTPHREVSVLPLAPYVRQKLLVAGFRTVKDLSTIRAADLAKEADISTDEAIEVLKVAATNDGAGLSGAVSAAELYEAQRGAVKLTTCSRNMDALLGGGIATGHITEFCGVPGIGKTQIGLQLCCSVQIPAASGGLEGSAIYIDTEGSFTAERAWDMATAIVGELQAAADSSGLGEAAALDVESMLQNIIYFRIHDVTEQLALIQLLPTFLQQHPQVRLVVIDSVTFHFRQDFRDMAQRTRLLAQMAQDMMELAESHHMAVVFMNQVTTRIEDNGGGKLVPALGDSWGHAASSRIILHWEGAQRQAHLYKSPYMPSATASYSVTLNGIRDPQPPTAAADAKRGALLLAPHDQQPVKHIKTS